MSYTPTPEDLEWTRKAIQGISTWASPSIGCVMKIDHENKQFLTFMKTNPTELETFNVEKIATNLNYLGYTETGSYIMGGMNSVDDILAALATVEQSCVIVLSEFHGKKYFLRLD